MNLHPLYSGNQVAMLYYCGYFAGVLMIHSVPLGGTDDFKLIQS